MSLNNLSEEAKQILTLARQESEQLKHFYIGTEHIFIALTEVENGVTQIALKNMSLKPNIVREMMRKWIGSGDGHQYWEEVLYTPRAKTVLHLAYEEASMNKFGLVEEMHIFLAILKEGQGFPVRLLRKLNISIPGMIQFIEEEGEKVPVHAKKVLIPTKTPLLDEFGKDLTCLAKEGEIDEIIGRKKEMLEVIRTLTRKTKNNPLLIGEAGVGKTAIAEGLALRTISEKPMEFLQNKRVIELNLASLVAGTRLRGEFEERLMGIINEAHDPEIILFIDEIHTIIGSGSAEGAMDASSILKPALARGKIRCVGATTINEYHKYIEKDSALERRFQPITIEEPGTDDTILILEGLRNRYEKHHHVKISDSAINAAVKLSEKYLPDRRLPDKALDLLDEACSRKAVPMLSVYNLAKYEQESMETNTKVTKDDITNVLAEWTGLPVKKLTEKEQDKILHLADILKEKIIGQDEAVEKVSQKVRMAKAGLHDSNRPIGVFLFLGPTGVGKTELAKALSVALFDSEKEMIRLDMSEYMERHNVLRLIGAPPSYIGHDEEGQLTGALRRKPHTIVLLDEIEKAHPAIFDLFLQIFDDGRLTDSKGHTVDATNAIFIMTSNIGSDIYCTDNGFEQAYGVYDEKNKKTDEKDYLIRLRQIFHPEFLNRIDKTIIFKQLGIEDIKKIAHLMLNDLSLLLADKKITLQIDDSVVDFICHMGYNPNNGARELRRVIEQLVSEPLSEKILNREITKGDCAIISANEGTVEVRSVKISDGFKTI